MRNYNPILNTDSYKPSHWLQMPPGSEIQHSYIESRGGTYDKTLFFGLQMFLKQYMSVPVTQEDINEAESFLSQHGEPFNKAGWQLLLERHKGVYPMRIRAVKEGTVVPIRNVLVTAENTDPDFMWMTSYLETAMLRAVWYPTTVATISYNIKQVIKSYLEETGDPEGINFKLHDFGARGVSSFESASIGGAAHLVNFMGSDTISGVIALQRYYNATVMPGYSIPASEHSTITSWGRENEKAAYENMLAQFGKKDAMFACVSDSYDILEACNMWASMREQIVKSGAIVVVRPDSGHPETVVLEVVKRLADGFGTTTNAKGYKVLNNVHVDYIFYPDAGSMTRYSKTLKTGQLYFYGNKKRDLTNGQIISYELVDCPDIQGKDILIIDDLCAKGFTFYNAGQKLKEKGANNIYLYVSHCEDSIYKGELIKSDFVDKVFTTDSILTDWSSNLLCDISN